MKRFFVLGLLLAAAACSATPADPAADPGAGGASSTASAGGGSTGDFVGGSGTGGAGGVESCVADEYTAEGLPLDMHVMLDKSGSMSGALWNAVTGAIKGFVSDSPATDGMGVGIQYFPREAAGSTCDACTDQACCTACGATSMICGNTCVCSAVACEATDYASAEVEISELPAAKIAIFGSLNDQWPKGSTPTRPALEGAMSYAQSWAAQHPKRRVIVVLATDGLPTDECDANQVADVAAIAAGGLPSISTYVIGVGTETAALDAVASAGGTNAAFMVDASADVQEQFVEAMKSIHEKAAIACQYLIPDPPPGEELDFAAVNVRFTPSGQPPSTIPQVAGPADCDASGGWYYDDPQAPEQIVVCEATCDALKADAAPKVDILLGCATIAK